MLSHPNPKSKLMPNLHRLLICVALALGGLATAHADPAPARMPETTTTAFNGSVLSEEIPIGQTGRPEWTSARRFPGTRVYIQQEPWEAGVESWWRIKNHRDGTISHRLLEEVEIGLPYRMQLDLYNDIEGNEHGRFHDQSFNVELRWAFADWGRIWGNPTLYGEYKFADAHWGPDVYELKLLLGDQIAPRWHWGVNFVWEAETGWDREQEFQITGGLSYSLVDGKIGVGIEAYYDHDSVKGSRGDALEIFQIGPSVQVRLTSHLHIDANVMFGTNQDSDRQVAYIVLGCDFGGPTGHAQQEYTPTNGRGH